MNWFADFWNDQKKSSEVTEAKADTKAPEKTPQHVEKAEKVSNKYTELQYCCSVISSVNTKESHGSYMYTGGWRLMTYDLRNAGIDENEIYKFIEELAIKRKAEIEDELEKL